MAEVLKGGESNFYEYEINPFPKVNHTNVVAVGKYMETLREKKEFYKSVFFGGMLGKFMRKKSKMCGVDCLYPSYLFGQEILKRVLYINNMGVHSFLNHRFLVVKLNKENVANYLSKFKLNSKENKFVLDCTNTEKSKMSYYFPFYDNNLQNFFGNKTVKKDLVKKGLITPRGHIKYDPTYRQSMIKTLKILKRTSSFLGQKEPTSKDDNVKNTFKKMLLYPKRIILEPITNRCVGRLGNGKKGVSRYKSGFI